MDQVAAITMSDKTAPPTREATPSPSDSKDKKDAAGSAAAAAPAAEGDAAASDAATPAAASSSTPVAPLSQRLYSGNFEEEMGQVMKGLGSFWGGFKARSATTLTNLKSDLDKTVAQVQSDLKQLQETKVEVQTKDPETWEKEQAEEEERARVREEEEAARKAEEQASKDKGKGKARDDGEAEAPPATGATAAQATATALFSKLSTSLSTSQAQIQASLAQAVSAAAATANTAATTAQANTAQLRTQIAENVRLQSARENITLSLHQAEKLAEEYLKKGEGYLKEVERVAEKWVEENVRVVAPEGGDFVPSSGWETGEWYAFSTVSPGPSEPATPAAGPAGAGAKHSSAALAGSRKEALLRRLREDKDLLMVDPASEAETKERRDEFAAWVADKWPTSSQDGRAAEEGNVGTIRMALVPEHLSDEQFWQRYLFHKDMIEAADAKRKLLLQATQEQTDDFSWDDEEEGAESAPASASTPVAGAAAKTESATPTLPAATKVGAGAGATKESAATSPRDSEESYDVVSRQPSTAAATDADDDSDWE